MDHSFTKDDIEYHFLSIELNETGWAYNIVVNVVLPVKGQSYATPVFSNHIHDILSNIWKYVGSSFSYSETILVDGKEPTNPVFISPEKQKETPTKKSFGTFHDSEIHSLHFLIFGQSNNMPNPKDSQNISR